MRPRSSARQSPAGRGGGRYGYASETMLRAHGNAVRGSMRSAMRRARYPISPARPSASHRSTKGARSSTPSAGAPASGKPHSRASAAIRSVAMDTAMLSSTSPATGGAPLQAGPGFDRYSFRREKLAGGWTFRRDLQGGIQPMSLTVNTNLASLTAQRHLDESGDRLTASLERLSSGLRINNASDDAAGLAIADKLERDVRVAAQAVRNANDGISSLPIGEKALGKVTDVLTRLSELASESATGTVSDTQRSAIQQEFSQLLSEISRISNTTTFNGVQLLSAGTTVAVQVGLDGTTNSQISFNSVDGSLSGILAGQTAIAASTQGAAQSALGVLTSAIANVANTRGTLGAFESRLVTAMAGLITVGGLATGIDTNSIIDKLVALEKRPVALLGVEVQDVQATQTSINTLGGKLSTLRSAAHALGTTDGVLVRAATSSDTDVLAAAAGAGAQPGSVALTITQLARGSVAGPTVGVASATSTVASGPGTFQFQVGSGTVKSVNVDATTTLQGLATAINALDAGVTASAVNLGTASAPDFRLEIASKATGATSTVTVTHDDTALAVQTAQAGQNAQFTVDGFSGTFERESNTFGDVLPGVTVTLRNRGTATVTVADDADAITAKVKTLVAAFNDIVTFVTGESQVTETRASPEVASATP